ncbi:vWA domain-containing protein [Clostridium beijerinckii]|uniref:VWFA domain-containing protein n=1 Tax=Clostridium beijerinckii TaxID=1520 RepID=A0AAX0B848_CLOBE|nr:VWA domain-containing protein [Clostridium beijerinckii]NRT91535.1 hypothetical protein [Clostridium beijerinckii]NYC71060.1 hypothetical protein [Clostridium beijerinckii]
MKLKGNKRKFLKKVSLIISSMLILVSINSSEFRVKADIASKPQFTVTIDSYTPKNPKLGEEITINGTIHPQPFKISIPPKEIVLVLDSSGSMADNYKLTNLKKAATDFITKMSTVKNLKIAIVDFDTQATIMNKLTDVSSSTNVTALKRSINNLTAGGGTNTGEGLRQAAYLLSNSSEQNPLASKNIIFMSDGEPTYYNWQTANSGWIWGDYNGTYYTYYDWSLNRVNYGFDSNHMPSGYRTGPYTGNYTGYKYQGSSYSNYYTDITQSNVASNVSQSGTGYSDTDGKSLNYAKTIGEIIKGKGYNVFSIGYGLDSDGNTKMQQIHSSMSTSNSNFYETDSGAIDAVFSNIGDNIADSYPITNVNFNYDPNANTSIESINGNTIRLPNFNYKEVPGSNDGTTVTYSADPVPFTIKIKSNAYGDNISVFANSTVTFPWQSSIISANVPVQKISIEDNQLPDIHAILESITPNPANALQEIEIKYKINTDPFAYNLNGGSGGMITNAVFVVDLSSNMSQGNRWALMQNWFTNILLNDSNNGTDNALKGQNIKFGVVGYNDSVKYPVDNGTYDRLFNRNNSNERETLRQLFQNNIMMPQSSNNRNIRPALEKADDLLINKGDANANKAIILVNSGNVTYSQSDLDEIKNRGYKIISIDMSCDQNQNTTSNLSNMHKGLLGLDIDYLKSKNDGGNFNFGNIDMQNVADRLKAGISAKTLSINDAKLNFDLGSNFDAVEDGELGGTGKLRNITLPKITYTYNSQSSMWEQTSPQPIEVTFKVKSVDGKYGTLGFGPQDNNNISYTNFGGTITKKNIDTPSIYIGGVNNLQHGLYKGIDLSKNEPDIDGTTETFAKGATVTLGGYASGVANGNAITLKIADGINIEGDIKVYEVTNTGSINQIGIMSGQNGDYSYNVSNLSSANGKILVLYTEKTPEIQGDYTNIITVQSISKPATVRIGESPLPDLF